MRHSRVAVVAVVAMLVLLAACSPSADADAAALCDAASVLAASRTTLHLALEADRVGDRTEARRLAEEASRAADDAHQRLKTVSGETRPRPDYQLLLEVDLRFGQAANSLRPGFEGTHGSGDDEFARGEATLARVPSSLFVGCNDGQA
jgi:hypothetical protein